MKFPGIRRHHFREYLYVPNPIDIKVYDKLYELQSNIGHKYWQDFIEQYRLNCEFKNDISEVDTDTDYVLMLFFKERTDKNGKNELILNNKLEVSFLPNYLFGFETQKYKLKIHTRKQKDYYPRRPFLQIYTKELPNPTMFP